MDVKTGIKMYFVTAQLNSTQNKTKGKLLSSKDCFFIIPTKNKSEEIHVAGSTS
jgi:hypothetical protein